MPLNPALRILEPLSIIKTNVELKICNLEQQNIKYFLIVIFTCLVSLSFSQTSRDRVQIQNGTIVTDQGTLLRGGCYFTASHMGEAIPWDGFPLKNDIAKLKGFGLNCLHVYNEGAGENDAGYRAEIMDSLVKWTEELSLYLIITPGWWGGLESDFIYDYWRFYASRYNNKTHLIYEIANEPGDIPLDSLTMDMERRAYDTIRKYDANTHVLFITSGVEKADELIESFNYLGNDIDWTNASIAAHGYGWPAHNIIDFVEEVKGYGYALTLTEFHSFENKHANLAVTRLCENEFVSYVHFLPILDMINDPTIFTDRIESSEVRWVPDFGEWPESISEIKYQSPYKTWKAAFYDDGAGWRTKIFGSILDWMRQDSWVAYFNLDFEEGPKSFSVDCSSTQGGGKIILRLDSFNGPVVGTCTVGSTGSMDKYETFTCNITQDFSGVHKIFMDFDQNGGFYLFNVKQWSFSKDEILTTDDFGATIKKVIIYPNPASDYIELQSNDIETLEIYDIYGRLVKRKDLNYNYSRISIGNIESGEYILKLTNRTNVYFRKLIVE